MTTSPAPPRIVPNAAFPAAAMPMIAGAAFNGTSADAWRNNVEKILLASATRAGATQTATQTAFNAVALIWFLNVTARTVGGAPLARVRLRHFIPTLGTINPNNEINGNAFDPTVQLHWGFIGPGLGAATSGGYTRCTMFDPAPLGRRYALRVEFEADITDLTYSLDCMELVG